MELVTLSGCATGRNVVVGGNELLGLVRVLRYAGIQSVMVSLWHVQDKSTAELMTSFYARLGDGRDKAKALCKGCNSHTDTAGSLPTAYRHDIVESRNLRLVGMCEQGPGSLEAIALHESAEG